MRCVGSEAERKDAWARFRPMSTRELDEAKRCFQRPIFYDSMGRRNWRAYWCPECGEYEEWKDGSLYSGSNMNNHHGDSVMCSQCGYTGELVCLGRCRSFRTVNPKAQILWVHAEGEWLILEAGYGRLEYSLEDLDPWPTIDWVARYAVKPGVRLKWKDGQYSGGGFRTKRWSDRVYGEKDYRSASFTEPFPRSMYTERTDTYSVMGLDEALKKTAMRYCAIEEMYLRELNHSFGDGQYIPTNRVTTYLGESAKHPQLEMLVKCGHTDVVRALLEDGSRGAWKWSARTPWEFFRMGKAEYKKFHRAGMTAQELSSYRMWTDGAIEDYIALKTQFGKSLSEFCNLVGKSWKRQKKAAAYLRGKPYLTWVDTMKMEQRLGNRTDFDSVLMPENLQARHDACVLLEQQRIEQERRLEKLDRDERLKTIGKEYKKARYKELRRECEFELDGLCIRVPRSGAEIVREGEYLKHCVAGYAERHLRGVKTILFLRWADDPETPYVTIELNRGELTLPQVFGYHDDNKFDAERQRLTALPREIHEEFLAAWVEWMRQGSRKTRSGKPIIEAGA